MIYEGKIYGPYLRDDGRMHVVIYNGDKNRKTVSYPKFLIENYLGRFLLENETVDHIDCNFTNNDLSNLRVIDRNEHIRQDVLRNRDTKLICSYCENEFIVKGNKLGQRNNNRTDRRQSGYFCSRKCSGKYGKQVQMNEIKPIVLETIYPEKYRLKETLWNNY